MLFNSLEFMVFFPIVVFLYFLLPQKYRWALLLGASYYFYMAWKPEYILLILASTIVDYIVSLKMGAKKDKKDRKKYLYISLASNLGMLFLFKYFGFLQESIAAISSLFGGHYKGLSLDLILPMGISFYTFQTLSYTIDVYNGKIKAEKHFGIFALYVSFFPQLVAGPIERSDRLLPQFYQNHKFDYDRVTDGMKRIAMGLFKKVVIADRIAIAVNTVYNNPRDYQGILLIIATILFAIQIYCDFSGYSDIAIGAAKVMGFDLIENFKRPYFAKSVGEFWSRWHISLSTWFRDYVYIPLGGNRTRKIKAYRNIVITFLVSGLWHGANWTFVAWGGIHGIYLLIEKAIGIKAKKQSKGILKSLIGITRTFVLVCIAWIFFRANTFSDAIYIISHLIFDPRELMNMHQIKSELLNIGLDKLQWMISFTSIGIMILVQYFEEKESIIERLKRRPVVVRWGLYYALIMAIIFLAITNNQEFIYFQF